MDRNAVRGILISLSIERADDNQAKAVSAKEATVTHRGEGYLVIFVAWTMFIFCQCSDMIIER